MKVAASKTLPFLALLLKTDAFACGAAVRTNELERRLGTRLPVLRQGLQRHADAREYRPF